MNNTKLKNELIYHEGKKIRVYRDSLGFLTAGIGHLLTSADGVLKEGDIINEHQIQEWFEKDILIAINTAKKYCGTSFDTLTEERQRILVNLCFNIGPKINQFKILKAAIQKSDWLAASLAMKNSMWFKQVGRRGPDLVNAIETNIITFPK